MPINLAMTLQQAKSRTGPSSNIAFTLHISRAMAHTSRSVFATGHSFSPGIPLDNAIISISQPASPSARTSASRQTVKTSNRGNVNIYALPSEATTRNLIARYFGDTGLLFPYIYEQTFLDTYNEIKANDFTKIRRTWLGLLNMIMAMATSTTVENGLSAEKRAQDSDVYYQRATGLCEKQIMRGTSLEIGKSSSRESLSLANDRSSIPPFDRSIPARHTAIGGSMDCARSCSKRRPPTRAPLHCCFYSFFFLGSRVSKEDLVWLRCA
jgi:hypothetical protein